MTVHIRVRNYQSIEDATLEVSGLTVVTGQNNSGKSALLRAVHGAFTNARGTKYVRHGCDHCTVDVAFSDGHRVTWEKGEGVNRYTIDGGKPLNKVGQAVPKEVEVLNVLPITAAGREVWPQFAQQFTGQVFLLDQPGSVLAEAISDVTRVGVLNEALRQAQSDRRSVGAELKVRVTDVGRLGLLEQGFSGLDAVERMVSEATTLEQVTTEYQKSLDAIRILRERCLNLADSIATLLPVRGVVVPSSDGLPHDLELAGNLRDLASKLRLALGVLTALSPVAAVDIPEVDPRIQKMVEAQAWLVGVRNQLQAVGAIVGGTLRDALDTHLPDVLEAQGALETLQGCLQLRDEDTRLRGLLQSLTAEIEATDIQYESVVREVTELLGLLGSCPMCGHG